MTPMPSHRVFRHMQCSNTCFNNLSAVHIGVVVGGVSVIDSRLVGSLGELPQEQKILKGNLPRVIYHQVY